MEVSEKISPSNFSPEYICTCVSISTNIYLHIYSSLSFFTIQRASKVHHSYREKNMAPETARFKVLHYFAGLKLIAGHLINVISTRRGEMRRPREMERDVLHEGKGSNVPSWRHKVEGVLSIDLYRELSKAPSRGAKN